MCRYLFLIALIICATLAPCLSDEAVRPKVGLVLGGGGALGFAHIGVLKVLEEQQVPIDYIAGTSMGAIVAGMYASGMSPDEIENQFLSLDWWEVLKDKSPHQYLSYRRKQENKRFMDMEFGLANRGLAFKPGMAYGQKLNNVLCTFAINSAGIHDFDQLNIPYRAVATDLRSGESVQLDHGNLATAMRASMAVPGAFTPVRIGDMVLIDGGVLNNIPVDAVLDMGADIAIAVDVGASQAIKSEMSDFQTLGDVVGRTYTIVQRPSQERQLALADIIIEPDLAEASASQFHRAAAIIPAGHAAALEHLDALNAYAVDEPAYAEYLQRQRRQHSKTIIIADIEINADNTIAVPMIRNRIHTGTGPLDLPTLYEDLYRIHGLGLYQTVTYELEPQEDGDYRLIFDSDEKFWGPNYLHFGMRAETATDSSLIWSLLLNYDRRPVNRLGGELRFELEGGGDIRRIETEWYQPVSESGSFFLAPSIQLFNRNSDLYIDTEPIGEVEQNYVGARLDFGVSAFEYGEWRIGALVADVRETGDSGFISLGVENQTVVAATTQLVLDQLDDPIFPTRGYRLSVNGVFAFDEAGSTIPYNQLEIDGRLPLTLGRHTLTPRVLGGSSFGSLGSDEQPFFALFDVGGYDTFAGYAPYQLWGYYYGIGQLEYRFRIGKLPPTMGNGIYALLRQDAGHAWIDAEGIDMDDINFGTLLGLAADTAIGTCRVAVGKVEGLDIRFYFSIGNTF